MNVPEGALKPCDWCDRDTQVTCPECNGTGLVANTKPEGRELAEQVCSEPVNPPHHSNTEQSLEKILQENTTHYERTCMFCGFTWLGLHCPHDGYQNPCPRCERKPHTIDYHDCTCLGVPDFAELKSALATHTAEAVRASRLSDNHDWDAETFKRQDVIVCRRCATTYQTHGNKPCKGKMAKITLREFNND